MTNGLRFESRTYMNEDSAKAIKQAWEEHKNRGEEFSADAKTAELDIYGPISNRLLKEVSGFLADVKGKDLTVRINSPGGDYYAGLSIANRLDEHKGDIHTIVDGSGRFCRSCGVHGWGQENHETVFPTHVPPRHDDCVRKSLRHGEGDKAAESQ